jgi:hypothetical protein
MTVSDCLSTPQSHYFIVLIQVFQEFDFKLIFEHLCQKTFLKESNRILFKRHSHRLITANSKNIYLDQTEVHKNRAFFYLL